MDINLLAAGFAIKRTKSREREADFSARRPGLRSMSFAVDKHINLLKKFHLFGFIY